MPKKKSRNLALPPATMLKLQILRDDPLVQEHKKLLREAGAHPEAARKRSSLAEEICRKYKLADTEGWYLEFGRDWESLLARQYLVSDIVRISTNWRSRYSPDVPADTVIPKASVNAFRKLFCPKPLDPSPILTIEIDLSRVKRNALAPLVSEVTQAIRQGLVDLPNSRRKPPDMWPQNLVRDYTRFQLHQQGMPFRWIAYRERTGRTPSGPVSGPIPAESSVRESVQRVHLIAFGQPYSARRHRTELRGGPLQQAYAEFRCPQHGRDLCPLTCMHATELIKKTELLLK